MSARGGRVRSAGGRASLPLEALARLSSVEEEIELGLVAWCREAARQVLARMWEDDVARLCGERWRPRSGARVARAGACLSDIVLAGQRVRVRRPRVRSREGREIELDTYRFVTARDPLDRNGLAEITFGVCTGSSPSGQPRRDVIDRRFADAVARELGAKLAQPSWSYSPCLILGEVPFREQSALVALGLGPDGTRRVLGLRAGSCENAQAGAALLQAVSDRSAPAHPPELVVVGERPVLETAARRHFGASLPVYRCPIEKRRRVIGLLPPDAQPAALRALRAAYELGSEDRARRALRSLARSWTRKHPGAAKALLDGLAETLTLHRLRDAAALRRAPAPEPRRPRPRART